MENRQVSWKELNIKDKLAIATALFAFFIGWGLTIAAFIVPPVGIISDGVLWVLGQALIYSASVFGITGYFNAETKRMKREVKQYVDKQLNN